jgi:hypothetical protein
MDLDRVFEECYQASSVLLEDTAEPTQTLAPGMLAAQNVTRWRYKWARILLHRPILLWYTISKTPFMELPEEKRRFVRLCRDITRDLIQDISRTW